MRLQRYEKVSKMQKKKGFSFHFRTKVPSAGITTAGDGRNGAQDTTPQGS